MRPFFSSNGDNIASSSHLESSGRNGPPTQNRTIVKNTFLDVVDVENLEETQSLKRSASLGDLSKSSNQSEDEKGYWLPSLWSSSNSSERKKLEGVQGTVETTPWLYSQTAQQQRPHQQQQQHTRSECNPSNSYSGSLRVDHQRYHMQSGTGMTSSSTSHQLSRHRQATQQMPPGIFQGGPPAPPRLKEPSAPEEECIPSANFPPYPDRAYSDNASSSQPVQLRRQSADVRSMLSSIWGQGSSEQHPEAGSSAYPQAGSTAQAERRRPSTSDQDTDLLVREIHAEIRGRLAIEKLEELAERGELASIPRNETNALTSIGSAQHFNGTCTPCAYWFKGICKYSIACTYCHFVHAGQKSKRLRPSKQTRMRIRKWEAEVNAADTGSAHCDSDEYQNESEQQEGVTNEMVPRQLLNL